MLALVTTAVLGGRTGRLGSIKADAGVALRVNNGLIQSSPSVFPPAGLINLQPQLCSTPVSTPVSSNELKHSIKQQGLG